MEETCKEIEALLVDYTDEQLSPEASNKVTEHLAQCENCRKVLNALQQSLELADIIWTDSLTETKNIRIPIPRKIRKLSWRHYAAIAASILLAVTTSIVWRELVKPVEKAPTVKLQETMKTPLKPRIHSLSCYRISLVLPSRTRILPRGFHLHERHFARLA